MRSRRTISLHSNEPAHAEVLGYLDSFECDHRRHQALLQMVLTGFRVMVKFEQGSEALFHARNPDVTHLMDGLPAGMARGGAGVIENASTRPKALPKVQRIKPAPHPVQPESTPAAVPMPEGIIQTRTIKAMDEQASTRQRPASSEIQIISTVDDLIEDPELIEHEGFDAEAQDEPEDVVDALALLKRIVDQEE